MPKQGEYFINAVGRRVKAHGGSTPAASEITPGPGPQMQPGSGQAVDIFGRVYDERIPAFLSTGTNFVIDRLHSAGPTKTNGGNTYRYLTFESLQDLADSKTPAYQWGDNELGLPPTWWDEHNLPPGAIEPGYGDGGSPYGPEWGVDAPQQGNGWTQIGPNSYEFNAPPGARWQALGFDQPKDTPMSMSFTVTVYENMDMPDMIFRFDESSEAGAVSINRLGYYEFEFTSPDGDPRSRFVCRGEEPWSPLPARIVIENVVMRSLAPPSYVGGAAIEGPTDEPGWLTANPGTWSGGDQFRYEWFRNGQPTGNTTDTIQTSFFDSEATFDVDIWCSNPVGETGPERVSITLDEFGALETIGFDFSDFTTMFQDREGTIPVTQVGDRIARINGVGLTLVAPDNGDSRPTVVDVNGIGAAGHNSLFGQHLTTGVAGSLIIDGNTVSLFYVFRFDSDLDNNEGSFSLGNSTFGSDWQQPQTCVTWLNQTDQVAFYRGDQSVPNGDRPCIMNSDSTVGDLVMIEYHCSPTDNRVLVNGVEAPPEWYSDDNPTATPFQVDVVSTACRFNGVLERFGDVTFCEFQYAANMSVEDQDELRSDLLTKWGLGP